MVKLSRGEVDFCFIVVIIFDFVLLSQRLRHCFSQRSRLSVRFWIRELLVFAPRRLIRRLWPDPSKFFSDRIQWIVRCVSK